MLLLLPRCPIHSSFFRAPSRSLSIPPPPVAPSTFVTVVLLSGSVAARRCGSPFQASSQCSCPVALVCLHDKVAVYVHLPLCLCSECFFLFILISFPSLRHDPDVAAHCSGERFLVHLADLAARLLATPCCTPAWLCVPPIQKSAAQRQCDNGGNIGAAAAAAIGSGVHQARDPNRYARLCTQTTVAEAPALTNCQHAPSAGRPPLPPTRSRPCAAILALSGAAPWRRRDPGCCHRSAADGRTSAGDAFGACAQPPSPGNRCGCCGQNANVIVTQAGASTPPPPSPFTEERADATAAALVQQPQPPHGRQPSRRAGWPSEGPRRLRDDGTCAPAPTRLRR